jgi:glycosyltransferase involved in cell wall biosynthesis
LRAMEAGTVLGGQARVSQAGRQSLPAQAELAALGPGGSGLALVGEVATEFGGTERVQKAVLDRFPAARAFVLGIQSSSGSEAFADERITMVGHGRRSRPFLAPLYARRFSRLDLGHAAVVLSFAMHGWTLAVRYSPPARHIVYTCGPPASLYPPRSEDYVRANAAPLRPLIRALRPALRAHNRGLMNRPHRVLANSNWSAERIAAAFGLPADVVHPPVRTTFFTPREQPRSGLLMVARLAPQKRVDIAVEAARLAGEHLTVVGGGWLLESWRRQAPAGVDFAGALSDEELREQYRSARALICPTVEEFGIVMAEAHACGTPVIAPRKGGAVEIVEEARTGILVERSEPGAIADAVRRLGREDLDPVACRASAERFSEQRFVAGLERVLAEELERAPATGSGVIPRWS